MSIAEDKEVARLLQPLKDEILRLKEEAALGGSSARSGKTDRRHEQDRTGASKLSAYHADFILKKFQKEFKQRSSGAGLLEIWHVFRENDREEPYGTLNKNEFVDAIMDYGGSGSSRRLQITRLEAEALFYLFDSNRSGSINYVEAIEGLCSELPEVRRKKVERVFTALDPENQGKLIYSEMMERFDPEIHPQYQMAGIDPGQVRKSVEETLKLCEERGDNRDEDRSDGFISRTEFMRFFRGISNSIESERYFEMVLEAFLGDPYFDFVTPPKPKPRKKSPDRR